MSMQSSPVTTMTILEIYARVRLQGRSLLAKIGVPTRELSPFRILLFMLLVVYPLFSIFGGSSSGSNDDDTHTNHDRSTDLEQPYADIAEAWALWSRDFYYYRPDTPPLKLRGNAEPSDGRHIQRARRPHGSRLHLRSEAIGALRTAHESILKCIVHSGFRSQARDLYDGSGIVMVASKDFLGPAIISLRMLRRSGNELPVEVFLPRRTDNETAICGTVFQKLNAQCIVLEDFLTPQQSKGLTTHQIKTFAMIFSRFARVLYLDADTIPLIDPSEYIQSPPFTDTGLVIWSDFWIATEDPVFYTIVGADDFPETLPPTASHTSQLLVDKHQHLETLLLAAYYNIHGPEYFHPLLTQGASSTSDKETFLAAAEVLHKPWRRVHKPISEIGTRRSAEAQAHPRDDWDHNGDEGNDGPDVRWAFLHARHPRMDPAGLRKAKLGEGRIWGEKEEAEKEFGSDVERAVWWEMVYVGCSLQDTVQGWEGVCDALEKHWNVVFEPEPKPEEVVEKEASLRRRGGR